MKNFTRLILILSMSCYGASAWAQVGIGIADPDTSAVLDITSNTKGVLFPRIENSSFLNNTKGLFFYATEDNKFYYYNGTDWQCVNPFSSTDPNTATLDGGLTVSGDVAINGDAILNYLKVNGLVEINSTLVAEKIQMTKGITPLDIIRRNSSTSDEVYIGNSADNLNLQTGSGSDLYHVKGSTPNKIWDSSNDGSLSGLDADLLDGTQLSTITDKIDQQANAKTTTIRNDLGYEGPGPEFPTGLTYSSYIYQRNGIVYIQGSINLNGNTSYDGSTL